MIKTTKSRLGIYVCLYAVGSIMVSVTENGWIAVSGLALVWVCAALMANMGLTYLQKTGYFERLGSRIEQMSSKLSRNRKP